MTCRVCGNQNKKIFSSVRLPECIWPTKKKSTFSKCHVYSCIKCNHLQLQNFSKKKISEFYGDTQFVLDKSTLNKQRISLIKKKYGKIYFKNKKILEIGGGFNPIFKNKNTFISDIKIQKKNKINFKNRFYEIDIEEKKIEKKFDIIFLMHTLEHFKYPLKALKNLKSSLKKNSKIFIEIPNLDFYVRKNTFYVLFHQHLNIFNLKHLKNILGHSGLKIEKILIKKEVIFCSVNLSKNEIKKTQIKKIDNKKIFKTFEKNLNLMKKKITVFLQNRKFDIYGAGGSMVLLISSIPKVKNNINKIFDSQVSKHGKIFPGTNIKILKNNKTQHSQKFTSLSSYKTNKKNNLQIHTL